MSPNIGRRDMLAIFTISIFVSDQISKLEQMLQFLHLLLSFWVKYVALLWNDNLMRRVIGIFLLVWVLLIWVRLLVVRLWMVVVLFWMVVVRRWRWILKIAMSSVSFTTGSRDQGDESSC